ncbi:MAG: shikimate dehydrogenase, partial [Mycobacteriales bacterium]
MLRAGACRAGVLGSPIAHSLSPVLHRAAYAALGLSSWRYDAYECDEVGLTDVVGGLDDSWVGLSLTMPLKRVALRIADEASDLAVALGAANTLLLRDGRRFADNTDAPGMVDALTEAGVGAPGSVLIVGAGGTAQAALGAVSMLRVSPAVTIAVRDPARSLEVQATARRLGLDVTVELFAELPRLVSAADLVVSTVPVQASPALAELPWTGQGVFFDALYAPWPTPAAAAVLRAGGTVISGLELLLHQAAHQVRLMT